MVIRTIPPMATKGHGKILLSHMRPEQTGISPDPLLCAGFQRHRAPEPHETGMVSLD